MKINPIWNLENVQIEILNKTTKFNSTLINANKTVNICKIQQKKIEEYKPDQK